MLSRIVRATKNRSFGEIAELVAKNITHLLRQQTPEARELRARDRAFDDKWGTDTSGTRDLSSLDITIDQARHGVRYQASDDENLTAILGELEVPLSEYSFIDFGCGKGRILLTAALEPFRTVYGVEFSEELAAVARSNLGIFLKKAQARSQVEVICEDAAQFRIPEGNLIAYFYNPFDETIMTQVVANLETALDSEDREIQVIYVDPQCEQVFDASGRWQKRTTRDTLVLSARSEA